MSRAGYRDDLAYGGGGGGGGGGRGSTRWDSERFAMERERNRPAPDNFDDRDPFSRRSGGGHARERSVDEIYERRGPRGFDDDRFERRQYYDDEPRYERERSFGRDRGDSTSVTIEKERIYSPSPPRRASGNRPSFLRRQSSLDTFDRKPLTRFVEREEYGPPARYRQDIRPPAMTPIPLPRTRQLGPPPRRLEREYDDEIKIAEPDYYGDEEFRGYPERIREREVIRRRRHRSNSRESHSHRSRSHRGSMSVRSSSRGSSSSSGTETVRSEFPKKGKTRMPARLVSKKAIIDLGYPFEEEGDTIIIMKALGPENIDEVIKLSEDYKSSNDHIHETLSKTYLVGAEPTLVSGGRSNGGTTVYEEHKTHDVYTVPAPPPSIPPQAPTIISPHLPAQNYEVVTDTKIIERRSPSPARSHGGPIIVDAGRPRNESTFIDHRHSEVIDRSDAVPVGPLALAMPAERHRSKDERAIRAEIKALEAEKDALRAEKRADRDYRKGERSRHHGRHSHGDLVLYDEERFERGNEEVTLVRRERIEEPDGGVRIEKDKKGRMAISVPRYLR